MIQGDPLAAKTEDGNPLAMPNAYSPRWFATFLADLDPTLVAGDVAFLSRQLPDADDFEWDLYTPAELTAEGAAAGLSLRAACASFDEARQSRGETRRMQLVFERPVESAG